ncbi:ubiquitin carboxyl-terminal hydrolase 20 isoform X1 [Gossypium hirsutum]|uniref:Ubiquitin carboxyl-terminal hydrolase n=1 Tax=Gossypium hirsutum TaxID=3635 RepID=A0A1U8MST4_GOSHI|nr:ubiquitin carboxyl-terminal hydrolase 20-like isoform X1 [Gossypium hirsutum]
METQTYTDKPNDLSPSKIDQVPSLVPGSLSGSSSFSPMVAVNDSLDLATMLESFLVDETAVTPEGLNVLSLTYQQPPSSSSDEYELSQILALLPYDSKQPHDPWVPSNEGFRIANEPTGVGAGLENLGNTCFINAVLQCFTHTVPFVLGLRSLNHHEKPCHRNINSFCLLCAVHDHIELSLNSSGGVVSPSKIFDNLSYISPSFERYQQEDAHEFLQCLLNRLEECCLDLKLKDDCSSSPDICLVKKVFGGQLVRKLCCCNCGHISYSYEPLIDLSLEIEDVDTLLSALESFTKVEKIDDLVAKFRCENCEDKVSVEKQLMLDQAPSVAAFHLKRFKTKATYVKKIDKHVVFPLELDLQPYTNVNQTSNNEELKYQLYAVVKHSGYNPTSGHYVCYIRSSPDTWHNLNDSIVTSVEEGEVLSQEAYILFYVREGIPWFSTAIEVHKPCTDLGTSDPSPKSVLDNTVCVSDLQPVNNTDANGYESKVVADETSIQFSRETQLMLELDEPCVVTKGISGPLSESKPKSIDLSDDSPISISTASNLGENNSNQSTFPRMPFRSQLPVHTPLFRSKEKKCAINRRRAVNRPRVLHRRSEAMRHVKRKLNQRGMKSMALLALQPVGKMKRRR